MTEFLYWKPQGETAYCVKVHSEWVYVGDEPGILDKWRATVGHPSMRRVSGTPRGLVAKVSTRKRMEAMPSAWNDKILQRVAGRR